MLASQEAAMSEAMSLSASLAWTREVLVHWRGWTRGHWRVTLLLSALAFVVGWIWNTFLMAVDLDGSEVPPGTETAATADGHTANGLFWLLLFSFVAGLVTYAWSRGWTNFRADVVALPRRFGEAMTTSRSLAFAMLLWGVAVSLVISTLISSAVSLALGLVLLALAATPIGVILNFALIRVWRGLCGIVAPAAGPRLAVMVSPFIVMVGEALGLFTDWVIGGWLIELLLGVVFAVVSVVLVRTAPPRAAVMLIVAGAVVAWQVARVRWAYADDGGWSECVSSDGRPCSELGLGGVFAWLGSPGAGHVVARGSLGGISAAVGTVLGVGVGGAAAGLAVAAAQVAATGRLPDQRSGGDGRQGASERDRAYDPDRSGTGSDRDVTAPLDVHEPGTAQPETSQHTVSYDDSPLRPAPGDEPAAVAPGSEPAPGTPGGDQPDRYGDINDFLPEPPDRKDDRENRPPQR